MHPSLSSRPLALSRRSYRPPANAHVIPQQPPHPLAGRAWKQLTDPCQPNSAIKIDYLSNPEPCLRDAWRRASIEREDFCGHIFADKRGGMGRYTCKPDVSDDWASRRGYTPFGTTSPAYNEFVNAWGYNGACTKYTLSGSGFTAELESLAMCARANPTSPSTLALFAYVELPVRVSGVVPCIVLCIVTNRPTTSTYRLITLTPLSQIVHRDEPTGERRSLAGCGNDCCSAYGDLNACRGGLTNCCKGCPDSYDVEFNGYLRLFPGLYRFAGNSDTWRGTRVQLFLETARNIRKVTNSDGTRTTYTLNVVANPIPSTSQYWTQLKGLEHAFWELTGRWFGNFEDSCNSRVIEVTVTIPGTGQKVPLK